MGRLAGLGRPVNGAAKLTLRLREYCSSAGCCKDTEGGLVTPSLCSPNRNFEIVGGLFEFNSGWSTHLALGL